MTKPFVAVLMGSDSDLPVMEASFKILKKFDIPFKTISQKVDDFRAKRITSYLNVVDEIVKRKQRWIAELDQAKESPRQVIGVYYNKFLFADSPYGNPVDGTKKTIEQIAQAFNVKIELVETLNDLL